MIQANIEKIRADINTVCQNLGRNPESITFVGVTKYANVVQMNQVVGAGVRHIGENRVGDAKEKFERIEKADQITKHMIGHLQTNKVKEAVKLFDMIQSVDSLKLAKEIDKQAAKLDKVMDILLEVNVSGEEQKDGFIFDEVLPAVEEVRQLPAVRILGLMTMAPLTKDQNIIRNCFRGLRHLSEEIKEKFAVNQNVEMKYLSMGMSHDYKIALEEGSNMVRIGRAIFI